MTERLSCPVDVYMLLERDGRLLMLRRAPNAAYAPNLLCPPSGHVDPDEHVLDAALRETAEEVGIVLHRDEVRPSVVLHHRGPTGGVRIGWFFRARPGWAGEPTNREPRKHSELVWIDRHAPPDDLVAYTWAGLRADEAGAPHAVHWQRPGSPLHYSSHYEHELMMLDAPVRP